MQWGLLALSIIFVIVAYVIIQGTRATLAWRKAAAQGDVKVIADIVEDALSVWRSTKRPKDIRPDVWRGVQSMQSVGVGPEFVGVSCEADGEFRLVSGCWVETRDVLHEGIAITARAADMLLYELPHFKAACVQIDVYTSFRDAEGVVRRHCILSTVAGREAARAVDWDEWTAEQIVEALGGRYRLGDSGQPLPIEPQAPPLLVDAGGNGSRAAAHP